MVSASLGVRLIAQSSAVSIYEAMFRLARPFVSMFALLAVAAAPENFTLDELEALEAEQTEAEQKLAALEAAENDTGTDLARIDADLISAAMESRRREEQAVTSERKLIDLRLRLTAAQSELLTDNAALEDLLAALITESERQPPALVVSPGRANLAVRSAILIGDAAPRLSSRADELGKEITSLNQLERSIRRERQRLETSESVLALKQAEIERLAATKRSQYEDISGETAVIRAHLASLGAEADNLRGLLAALEINAPGAPGSKPALRPRYAALTTPRTMTDATPGRINQTVLKPLGRQALGALQSPAAGLVSRAFGERTQGGNKTEGISIVTRQEAQIIAPVDGTIEYAGAFRSYGQMLILKTSDGYHVVLSGLGRIYGVPGQQVKAGEPVGRMSNRASPPPELYLELRRNGQPMNPANWMKRRG